VAAATLTSKGQVTIPKEIREALGLKTGDRLVFQLVAEGVVEIRPRTVDLRSLAGMISPEEKGVSLDQMEEAVAEGARRSGLPG